MKVLYLIYDHPRNPWVGGGGAVRAYELARRLARRGHGVTIVSGMYPGAVDYKEDGLLYRFVGSPSGYVLSTLSFAFQAARFVARRGEEFDIVVEDFAPWNPVFSRFLTRKPVVLHVNHREGMGIMRRWPVIGIPFYLIERFYPRLYSRLTALSEGTKAKLGRPDARVVPAGISESVITGREEPGDRGYVLYVGRLHMKNKGLDTLMEAARILDGPRLVVAGRGPDERRLREIARGLNVEFAGFVDEAEKLRLMRGASLLVLPSRFEGWGIVVLEAAASGTPVVVSDIPELAFAAKGGFGVLFKTGDARDLAMKISSLLSDGRLRARMASSALKYVRGYTWERIAQEYEVYLLSVAQGPETT